MKANLLTVIAFAGSFATGFADPAPGELGQSPSEATKAKALVAHQDGSEKVSIDQDKQAANAQELIFEQTNTTVIELLTKVEILMAQATDRLEDGNTDSDTIAMQTEIIEKIYEAAKEKAQSSPGPSQPSMGAMLEMMGQMMGKEPGKDQDLKSEKGGEGSTGDSDSANTQNKGKSNGENGEERRVPRAAGQSGNTLPPEFQKALDGYNKGAKAN
ncbi:MAG: hypothetical protein ACJAVK_002893 [Akkermansiaceae bacterium]|jgi:hypothetical protein